MGKAGQRALTRDVGCHVIASHLIVVLYVVVGAAALIGADQSRDMGGLRWIVYALRVGFIAALFGVRSSILVRRERPGTASAAIALIELGVHSIVILIVLGFAVMTNLAIFNPMVW